jgi:hypothetical protein
MYDLLPKAAVAWICVMVRRPIIYLIAFRYTGDCIVTTFLESSTLPKNFGQALRKSKVGIRCSFKGWAS